MATVESARLKIFLCHASKDKSFVRSVYSRLLEEGFQPWLDEENLLAGQDWQSEIRKEVRCSDVVIVCLSQHSTNKAGYFQKEIAFALDVANEQPESTIFLIPARIEECDIPERMRHLQSPKIFESKGYENLRSALRVRATSLGRSTSERSHSAKGQQARWSDLISPAYTNINYFGDAFIETFWTQDQLNLKKSGIFTVSLVGETGCGKTSTAYVLAEAQFNFLSDFTHGVEKEYCYRLPLPGSIYIVDHYSWEEDDLWNRTMSYMSNNSDLVFFLTTPKSHIEPQIERISEVSSSTKAPVVMVINQIDTLKGMSLNSLVGLMKDSTGRTPLPIAAAGGAGITDLRRFIVKARQMYLHK